MHRRVSASASAATVAALSFAIMSLGTPGGTQNYGDTLPIAEFRPANSGAFSPSITALGFRPRRTGRIRRPKIQAPLAGALILQLVRCHRNAPLPFKPSDYPALQAFCR